MSTKSILPQNVLIAEDKSEIIKEFENNMKGVLSSRLKPSPTRYEIKTLQMSNSKYKALVLFQQSSKLFMCDGKILTLKINNPCPADPREVEYIVARNLNRRFGISLERKLKNLSYEAKRASKFQLSYPLVVKFSDKFEFSIGKYFNIKLADESHDHIDELEGKLKKYTNGMDLDISNLEISVVEYPPRLDRSYFRLSLPSYAISNITEKNAILQGKRALIVIPDGAVMVTAGGKHLHITQPTVLLEPKNEDDLLLYLAWLKSSYFLWYCATIIGGIDLFQLLLVEAYFRIPMPRRDFFERFKNISNDVRNLLLDEKKYLKEVTKLIDRDNTDEVNKLTEKHNEVGGDAHCRAIDIEIFKYLGVSSEEAMDIYNTLNYLDIYDFKVKEKKEFQENLKVLDKYEAN